MAMYGCWRASALARRLAPAGPCLAPAGLCLPPSGPLPAAYLLLAFACRLSPAGLCLLPGACWPLPAPLQALACRLAPAAPCGPCLAPVGPCLLAFAWPLLAPAGPCWPLPGPCGLRPARLRSTGVRRHLLQPERRAAACCLDATPKGTASASWSPSGLPGLILGGSAL